LTRPSIPKPALAVTQVQRFDGTADGLFERAASQMGLVAERHHPYLNWKYVDSPNVTYQCFLVGGGSEPDGYFVTRLDQRRDGHCNGLVVDLLADPRNPRAFDSAISGAVRHLRREGAETVSILTTYPPFRARLEALGFLRGRQYTFVITGYDSLPNGPDPLDPSSWYLTLGDSDGDMWAEAQAWTIDRLATEPRQARTTSP
jgi:hypothetical protein